VQHARGIGSVGGLTEKLAINDNYSVGSEHDIVWTLSRDGQRFLARQPLGTFFGAFSGQLVFSYVSWLHFECDSRAS
jgi:hypothetical protein